MRVMLVIEQCSWTVNAYVCIVQYPLCVLKLIVDRTLCRIILSIIVLVINKLHSHFAVVKFFFMTRMVTDRTETQSS